MKRNIAILAACSVVLGLFLFFRRSSSDANVFDSAAAQADIAQVPSVHSNTSQRNLGVNNQLAPAAHAEVIPSAPEVTRPASPFLLGSASAPSALSPEIVVDKMRIIIHQYGSMFGGNPVGNNQEITEALNGGNPKQARFIDEESGLRINGRGELVDSWVLRSFSISSLELKWKSVPRVQT